MAVIYSTTIATDEMQLFISYAREDADNVRQIVEDLERFYDCWVDWDDIAPGRQWEQEIRRGILTSQHFLFFVSAHSLKSEWCMKELRWALWTRKPIMPIVFNPALKLPHSLTSIQWVVFGEDYELNIRKILAGLGAARSHTFWRAIALVEAIALVVGAILYGIAASG